MKHKNQKLQMVKELKSFVKNFALATKLVPDRENASSALDLGISTREFSFQNPKVPIPWFPQESNSAAICDDNNLLIRIAAKNCKVSQSFIREHLRKGDLTIPPKS
jgi:hypothetical protein